MRLCITKQEACSEAALGDRVQHRQGPSGGAVRKNKKIALFYVLKAPFYAKCTLPLFSDSNVSLLCR